ncbi:15040_t:CDS:2 [Entrophospora sp. SA101]|nr:15040_t:CDS:2 [Entrophospora sp. SA101]
MDNTKVICGSVEHFAYVRTIRKIRLMNKEYQSQPLHRVILLNNILEKLSNDSIQERERKELNVYKAKIFEINVKWNNNSGNSNNSNYCNSLRSRKSTLALCDLPLPSSRPSYLKNNCLTIYDESSDEFIVKDIPLARRKNRLSKMSTSSDSSSTNTLVRSYSSSSTKSTVSDVDTLNDDDWVFESEPILKEIMEITETEENCILKHRNCERIKEVMKKNLKDEKRKTLEAEGENVTNTNIIDVEKATETKMKTIKVKKMKAEDKVLINILETGALNYFIYSHRKDSEEEDKQKVQKVQKEKYIFKIREVP